MVKPRSMSLARSEEGQAVTEYIILLAVVVGFFLAVARGLGEYNLTSKLMNPLRTSYAAMYQYGHPKGKGPNDGGPENHPRLLQTGGATRAFADPEPK